MKADEVNQNAQLGNEMSFMEHLDELRRRIIKCLLIISLAFIFCFRFSDSIFNFLETPILKAMDEVQNLQIPIDGRTGDEKILPLSNLKEGDKGRYVFEKATKLGVVTVAPGTSVATVVTTNSVGNIGLFTDEVIYTENAIIPKGIKLPVNLEKTNVADVSELSAANGRMTVTTAMEPFTLYMTVSIYTAIAISLPFLLLQVWGFISPALYKHERAYVTPFILLSSISFVVGAAFAYYILFPPAVKYLLGLGSDFQLMLRATDYFDFITLIMLAMGLIFQMPAITYVLSRIGIISAGFLISNWKIAIVVILIIAAIVSPTADILNMILFAAPMILLYVISIFVAWFFGKKRKSHPDKI